MTQPTQPHFFPAGEDLPLFTGQAPTAVEKPFQPHAVHGQPSLIDLRPTLKGAEAKPEDQKPGAA